MKHIVRKAFCDYEKEEKYLNEMSAKGWALTDYSWCKYVFEDANKGEYIYSLELLKNPVNHPESQDYINFMEEMGVEFVTSYNRWVYFRKRAADGEFNIYSDIDSRIKHYKRVRILYLVIVLINLGVGLLNIYYGNIALSIGEPPINYYIAIFSMAIVALFSIFLVLPISNKIISLEEEKGIKE